MFILTSKHNQIIADLTAIHTKELSVEVEKNRLAELAYNELLADRDALAAKLEALTNSAPAFVSAKIEELREQLQTLKTQLLSVESSSPTARRARLNREGEIKRLNGEIAKTSEGLQRLLNNNE